MSLLHTILSSHVMIILFIYSTSLAWAQENKPCPKNGCRRPLVCESTTKTCQKTCAKHNDCKRGLSCDTDINACFDPIKRKKIQCKVSPACTQSGHCDFVPGKYREWANKLQCHPTKTQHCQQSTACKLKGLCTLLDGECKAFRDDCKQTESCKRAGGKYCIPVKGHCILIGENVPLIEK